MFFGYRGCSVYSVTHLYAVEIDLHNALLPPNGFYEQGEVCFESFAQPGTAVPQEYVFGCLLAYGACSSLAFAFACFFSGNTYLFKIEAVVSGEEVVFRRYNGKGKVRCYIFEWCPLVVYWCIFENVPAHHKWCHRYWYILI